MEPKSGYKTTEFLATAAGMFIVTLLALLTSFDLVHVSADQQARIMDFAGVAWVALPSVYALARSHVKAKAATLPSTAIASTTVEQSG